VVEEARPHVEWSGLVVFLGAEMKCSAVVSVDLRDRHPSVWLEDYSPMVERLRRGAFGFAAGCGFVVAHRQ
jgi:hypothetical protein